MATMQKNEIRERDKDMEKAVSIVHQRINDLVASGFWGKVTIDMQLGKPVNMTEAKTTKL